MGAADARDVLRLHAAAARSRPQRGSPEVRDFAGRARAVLTSLRQRPPLAVADLAITGDDLKEMGLEPGPGFAEILSDCLERVLDDPARNTRERLRAYVAERWLAPGAR